MMSSGSSDLSLNSAMQAAHAIEPITLLMYYFLSIVNDVVDFFLQYFYFCSISSFSNEFSKDWKN